MLAPRCSNKRGHTNEDSHMQDALQSTKSFSATVLYMPGTNSV